MNIHNLLFSILGHPILAKGPLPQKINQMSPETIRLLEHVVTALIVTIAGLLLCYVALSLRLWRERQAEKLWPSMGARIVKKIAKINLGKFPRVTIETGANGVERLEFDGTHHDCAIFAEDAESAKVVRIPVDEETYLAAKPGQEIWYKTGRHASQKEGEPDYVLLSSPPS